MPSFATTGHQVIPQRLLQEAVALQARLVKQEFLRRPWAPSISTFGKTYPSGYVGNSAYAYANCPHLASSDAEEQPLYGLIPIDPKSPDADCLTIIGALERTGDDPRLPHKGFGWFHFETVFQSVAKLDEPGERLAAWEHHKRGHTARQVMNILGAIEFAASDFIFQGISLYPQR